MYASKEVCAWYYLLAREETEAEPPVEDGEGKAEGDADREDDAVNLRLRHIRKGCFEPRLYTMFKPGFDRRNNLCEHPCKNQHEHQAYEEHLEKSSLAPDASAKDEL